MYIKRVKKRVFISLLIIKKTNQMKTQTQTLRKVFMWYEVKKLSDYSDSMVAKKLGIDRRTVSKYRKMSEEDFNSFVSKGRVYTRILSSYYSAVHSLLLVDNDLPAALIEDRLKEKYPDFPKVSSKTVYNFVHHVRRQEKIPVRDAVRQTEAMEEFAYGSQGQVDFGTAHMRRVDGSRLRVYFFALVLSRSRYKYVYFQTTPFTGTTAVEAHELAFGYIEGIPKKLVYDQDSVFLKSENLGDYLLADDFRRYRDERGISVEFCRKADPQSKGRIENVIGYVKNNFLRARAFYDIGRLNEEALCWLDRKANGTRHATTKRLPRREWMIEKEHLAPYCPSRLIPREEAPLYTVRKDNTISYKGNFYRVPYGTYNGKGPEVSLKADNGIVSLYSQQGELLAEHPVSLEKGKVVGGTTYRRDRNSRLEVLKREVLSLWEGGDTLSLFIDLIHKDKPRYLRDNLKIIREVMGEYGKELVEAALNYCLANKLYNAFYLKEAAAYHLESECRKRKHPPVIKPLHEGVRVGRYDTDAFIPERSKIRGYDKIMEL